MTVLVDFLVWAFEFIFVFAVELAAQTTLLHAIEAGQFNLDVLAVSLDLESNRFGDQFDAFVFMADDDGKDWVGPVLLFLSAGVS